MFDSYISLTYLTWPDLVLRIAFAMVVGLLLGLERDFKNKPVEFRAYMIVCVTTCMLAVLGQELYADFQDAEGVISLDLGKLIAGVLTGIGFLGAGAIMKRDEKAQLVGAATGASIWAAGGIGLAIGFGFYAIAGLTFAAIFGILLIGGLFIDHVFDKSDKEKKPAKKG